MLVLTRKTGESLIIGDGNITITILSQNNNHVRLGIEAPKNVSVHREEVYKRIQSVEENENNKRAKEDEAIQVQEDGDD